MYCGLAKVRVFARSQFVVLFFVSWPSKTLIGGTFNEYRSRSYSRR